MTKIKIDGEETELNQAVGKEIKYAEKKYGNPKYFSEWNVLLNKEVGKVADIVNKKIIHPHATADTDGKDLQEKLNKQLIRIIAISMRWIKNK